MPNMNDAHVRAIYAAADVFEDAIDALDLPPSALEGWKIDFDEAVAQLLHRLEQRGRA